MIKRPVSVTIVAWYVIVGAVFSLYALSRSNTDPMTQQIMGQSLLPIVVQQYLCFTGFVTSLAAGAAMLRGYNWGRVLFVGWSSINLLLGLVTSPMKLMLVPALMVVGLLAYFLFSAKADRFFLSAKNAAGA